MIQLIIYLQTQAGINDISFSAKQTSADNLGSSDGLIELFSKCIHQT